MFRFLFPRLTRDENRGSALFAALVAEARQTHWYVEGGVPDTLDGRFAVLSTVTALTTVRLEQGGPDGEAASVALAERFVEAMDAEHRQLGLGDPTLGKKVRQLMGALARRLELWREVVGGSRPWSEGTTDSQGSPAGQAECEHALRAFWARVSATPLAALSEGRIA
jgi:cytochrome b pre-mRNA-processing protein 3